ncbi:hypothetical protein B0H34DRAFT_690520 [Crassisporium funariophilum]|nr:hypothetical protein B0H34DRAFT_690520 [Crassisporium funariophilum]
MIYSRAAILSTGNSSTNVPMLCPLCPIGLNKQETTFWKYNLIYHMATFHLTEAGELPRCPPSLLIQGHISQQEDVANRLNPMITKGWREKNKFPDSDAIADLVKLEEAQLLEGAHCKSRKRAPLEVSHLSTASCRPSPMKVQRREHL